MDLGALLRQFGHDDKVKWILVLNRGRLHSRSLRGALHQVVPAELRQRFPPKGRARKLIPWFVLYALGKVTTQKLPGGVTFATLADGAFGVIALALGGSILKSLAQLGLFGATGKKATALDPSTPAAARALLAQRSRRRSRAPGPSSRRPSR
jgi:hypothetical protein